MSFILVKDYEKHHILIMADMIRVHLHPTKKDQGFVLNDQRAVAPRSMVMSWTEQSVADLLPGEGAIAPAKCSRVSRGRIAQ
jgi:hypothetical protein